MTTGGQEYPTTSMRARAIWLSGWVFVVAVLLYWAWRMVGLGFDLKQDFWVYFTPNHEIGDVDSALEHGNMVLRTAETIADEDESRKTPRQRQEEAAAAAAGHPPATIARPGPGLFDSPVSAQNFRQRWDHLKPVYSQILRGWVQNYEDLYRDQGPQGDYEMDYPPMRLLVMTFWTWHVQTNYPGITAYPRTPQRVFDPDRNQNVLATMDICQPMLMFNMICEAISALAIFVLVWLWMERRPMGPAIGDMAGSSPWRSRWGDPMLLMPVALFAICTLIRPHLSWQMPLPDNFESSPIDVRISSVGWWMMLLLRFLSVVCLARFLPRPFRAPMCAMVAATMAWLNPSSLPDDFGWPQWDCWLPPFFLVAAILITLDWWIAAGILLGIGCMFKGQLLFVSPVLILCPLVAGWLGRFFRILVGLMAGAGMIVWPWLVTNMKAERWIFLAFATAAFFCLLSVTRRFIWQQARESWRRFASDLPASLSQTILWSAAAFLLAVSTLILVVIARHGTPAMIALLGVAIFLVPWFLPRRLLAAWLLFAFAAPLWLAGTYGNGSRTWWDIGFIYGTQRHGDMQLGANSLSNLSSILHEKYGWNLHDPVATLKLPLAGTTTLDVQSFCGVIFGSEILMCTIAGAIHMRRKDPRFLIVLVTPWVLFTVLLTQMTARYMTLPAMVGSLLIGISAELSLLPFLSTILATVMLGNQMLASSPDTAPVAFSITQPTYPELGWLTVLLAAVYLVSALMPSMKWRRPVEVL
jgi:hypothetical protein